MGRVVVINHVTLDGVMQAPGDPEEDRRGGFPHGGWAGERADPSLGVKMGERMGAGHSWLFGRHTYEGVLASWNERGGPFKDALNATDKYVASRQADTALPWPNSTLLVGDAVDTVTDLKARVESNLVIMGSGVLIAALAGAGLIDEYLLMIHPVVLGQGRRLFSNTPTTLELLDCTRTDTGVIMATYASARPKLDA